MRFMHFHIKAVFGWCFLRVRTVALCLHVIAIIRTASGWMHNVCTQFPYQGSQCPDSVALSSNTVRTGASCLPNPCLQRRVGIFLNSEECPEVLPWRSNGCKFELFEASRHWWASGRMTGPSGRKHGIRLLWVGICTESSLNTWTSFFEILLKTLKYTASLIMTTTLHNSDFIKQNATNKTNNFK